MKHHLVDEVRGWLYFGGDWRKLRVEGPGVQGWARSGFGVAAGSDFAADAAVGGSVAAAYTEGPAAFGAGTLCAAAAVVVVVVVVEQIQVVFAKLSHSVLRACSQAPPDPVVPTESLPQQLVSAEALLWLIHSAFSVPVDIVPSETPPGWSLAVGVVAAE